MQHSQAADLAIDAAIRQHLREEGLHADLERYEMLRRAAILEQQARV